MVISLGSHHTPFRYGMRSLNTLADKHKLSQKFREKLEKLKEFKVSFVVQNLL